MKKTFLLTLAIPMTVTYMNGAASQAAFRISKLATPAGARALGSFLQPQATYFKTDKKAFLTTRIQQRDVFFKRNTAEPTLEERAMKEREDVMKKIFGTTNLNDALKLTKGRSHTDITGLITKKEAYHLTSILSRPDVLPELMCSSPWFLKTLVDFDETPLTIRSFINPLKDKFSFGYEGKPDTIYTTLEILLPKLSLIVEDNPLAASELLKAIDPERIVGKPLPLPFLLKMCISIENMKRSGQESFFKVTVSECMNEGAKEALARIIDSNLNHLEIVSYAISKQLIDMLILEYPETAQRLSAALNNKPLVKGFLTKEIGLMCMSKLEACSATRLVE